MFRRPLVAFDGSSHAWRALTEAVELAQANRGTLIVITVAAEPSVWAFSGYDAPVSVDRLSDELEREYQCCAESATVRLGNLVSCAQSRGGQERAMPRLRSCQCGSDAETRGSVAVRSPGGGRPW